MRALLLALAIMAAAVLPAGAHDIRKDGIMVVHPMSRPIMAGRTGAAYMAIANDRDAPLRLVGARAPGFEAAELHESFEEDGVSKMRLVPELEIAPGDTALLEPGGLHLMLLGAERAYAAGEEFPLTLIFEGDEELEVPVMIDDMAGTEGADHSGHQ